VADPEEESAGPQLNNGDLKFSPCAPAEGTRALIDLICKHNSLVASRLQAAAGVNNMASNVKTKIPHGFIYPGFNKIMDFQIKLFSWPDNRGNHLILIVRGIIDISGFEQIFREVASATQLLRDCKIVIDLQDAACSLETAAIPAFVDGMQTELWPPSNKVAIVAPRDIDQYDGLLALTSGLSKRDFKIAVFYDSKPAVTWLADNA
jgi:hypothetical protein